MRFSKLEEDIAKEIINIGLIKAADSMAFFTKEKVFIRSLDLEILDTSAIDQMYQNHDNQEDRYVLTTHIKGDLSGDCHLIFTSFSLYLTSLIFL